MTMHSIRTRFARLSLLLGLMAWMLGLSAAQVHKVLVQHVVCAEHGDVLELANDVAPADDGDTISPKAPHDHDCPLVGIATQTVAPDEAPLPPAPPDAQPIRHLGSLVDGVRGPPLAYAPKTSPPSGSAET